MNNFKEVGSIRDYVDGLLKNGAEAPLYAKFTRISARQGKVGEEVITKMGTGLVETRNVVKLDEKTNEPGWVVKNTTSNEEWIIEDSTFQKRYEIDTKNKSNQYNSKEKIFKPKGGPVHVVEIEESITFVAPWGADMNIEKGGFLVINSPTDIYGIQKKEFNETYAQCDREGKFKDDKYNNPEHQNSQTR